MTEIGMHGYQRQKGAVDTAHPIVKRIWREINAQQVNQEDFAFRSGVSVSTLSRWRRNERCPRLHELEAVLNTLGLDLVVRVRQE